MARALEPIFERDWFCYWPVIERAFHYAKLLLAIDFRRSQLVFGLKADSSSAKADDGALLLPA